MTSRKTQPAQSPGVGTGRRLHPVLRVVAYFLAMVAVNRLAFAVVPALVPSTPGWLLALVEGAVYLGGMLALTWAFCHYLDRKSLASLGLQRQGWLAKLASGLGLGAGLMFLVFAVLAAAGWLTAEPASPQLLPWVASALSWAALSFVEELAFRGYIMQGLAGAWGMPVAVVVSSLAFGMVHLVDPNVSLVAVLNISVGGLLFAVAYLVTRSLWLSAGIHIAWNLTEIQILGFPGSGYVEPALLRTTVSGPQWLTGGAFGPEAGLLALGAWLLGICLLVGYGMTRRRRSTSERQLSKP